VRQRSNLARGRAAQEDPPSVGSGELCRCWVLALPYRHTLAEHAEWKAAQPTHVPCCSSHGEPMTCEKYRRTHFVEVRPCCAIDAAALREVQ
jgi:hypothetical protein